MTRLEIKDLKGKEYSNTGHLIYEGGFNKDGKYEGFGKRYVNYSLQYEGSFVDGVPKGYGKIYHGKSVFYIGEIDKLPHGKGTIFFDDGIRTEGIFENGKIVEAKTYDYDGTFLYDGERKPEDSPDDTNYGWAGNGGIM